MKQEMINNNTKPEWIISSKAKNLFVSFMFIGVVAFGFTMITDSLRAWSSFLVSFFFFTSLALGGLFFVALQFLTNAGWSVNIRRYAEAMSSFLPWAFGLSIVFFLGAKNIYIWFDASNMIGDHALEGKISYLNPTSFFIRLVLFFSAWIVLQKWIMKITLADKAKDMYKKVVKPSVIFLIVFALSYSLFSVDLLMSLNPHWYSTIFGVYNFAGLFQSTLAFIILFVLYALKKSWIKGYVSENHLHDLGKLLFGFTTFWAYIAFSQFMLIWYANIPEETIYFLDRFNGEWIWVSIALLVFKFIVPFIALLPQWAKRNPSHLCAVSFLILFMQFIDVYWMVYPHYSKSVIKFSFAEVGIFLGFLGLFLYTSTKFLEKHSLIPKDDPFHDESTSHEVVY
ncbi:MAG: molybdopterin oxidoreductase [Bdellovibrionales bacterium]|nr:molybdopterin oxidoreductase [Bdellovibrionales bacterium]